MNSFTTANFWKAYAELSPDIKEQAQKAYRLWPEDPLYPSLHFKKVGQNLWSARISGGYRSLALKKDNDYYWFWIGDHGKYENFLN